MIKKIFLLLGAGIFLAGCNSQGSVHGTSTSSTDSSGRQIVQLVAKNSSKQTGSATISTVEGQTRVLIQVNSVSADAQPASLLLGSCDAPADVKYALSDAKGGVSDTYLKTDTGALQGLAVAIFKSSSDNKTMVACGDVQ